MDRKDILQQACELYLSGGLEAVSMRGLASNLGVTAPALYRHYASREQILLDVVGEAYRVCAEHLYEALSEPTPLERFLRAGQRYVDFAVSHPKLYEMLYIPGHALGGEPMPESLTARIASVGQFFDDRVRECIEAGLLHPAEPRSVALTLWAHAHGMISIYLRGCLPMEEDEFREAFRLSCGRILMGMATPLFAEQVPAMTDAAGCGAKPEPA